MYVKKEIREFIEKMPKKEKLTREWKKFIQESTIKHNLLIEHGKEEYECTHCGKYSYGKLLSDRNYKYHDICRFCGKKYEIITTRKRVVCSSPRRGFTCLPPKGGIEYLTLHYYYCCHLPVALSTYFSFLNGSIYSSIPI